MTYYNSVAKRIPRERLSAGAQSIYVLSDFWNRYKTRVQDYLIQREKAGLRTPVTDPTPDTSISRFAGQTQNETSIAWGGANIVVAFNDTGTLAATTFCSSCPSPSGSLSGNGYARSTNTGTSFVDKGMVLPDPIPAGSTFYDLEGDPVVVTADGTNFFYTTIATNTPTTTCAGGASSCSDIGFLRSTNGGSTWLGATSAASKDGSVHFLDKPWLAIDPANPANLYVTYTDFDGSGSGSCGALSRTAIELVRSTNGGANWSSPITIDEVCDQPFVQGSQVIAGPGNQVYVAYELIGADFCTREMRAAASSDNGQTFGTPVKIDDIVAAGDGLLLQGGFRPGFEFPTIAVDRTAGPNAGTVYVAWHDGRRVQVSDPLGVCGTYNYTDIFVSKSTDQGASWSSPVLVNNTVEPLPSGLGMDQYQPGLSVNKNGLVGITYYSRSKPNWLIKRQYSTSTNGVSWSTPGQMDSTSWPALKGQDSLASTDYMGDYDTTTIDATGTSASFFGSFSDNSAGSPDVKAKKFP